MSDVMIRVENLGKKYMIGHQAQSGGWKPNRGNYVALRDVLANGVKSFGKRLVGKESWSNYTKEDFWALKDINFEIKRGEVVGIIGRNGAGKSTLLKILSRITEPTIGRIELRGRVASLLEVGTGFHPELTGRENIYLNGSILGMSNVEIRKKFDEIVAFAEVEKFLDTPVKRYSSGMYVRLAFAVAAHLEPEILVVDEVLAVGDSQFQKRCLGKMSEVANQEGRTVIFVSHSMPMIASLCHRCILLQSGIILEDDAPGIVIVKYQSSGKHSPSIVDYEGLSNAPGDDWATLKKAWVENSKGKQSVDIDINETARIHMIYEIKKSFCKQPYPNFHFFDEQGNYAFVSSPDFYLNTPIDAGTYHASCEIPSNLLNDGLFSVGLALTFSHAGIHISFYDKHALMFNVIDSMEDIEIKRNGYAGRIPGIFRPSLNWKIGKIV